MADRRVVFWVQEETSGVEGVEVWARETTPNHDNDYALKGQTNGAGFIEFIIDANWVNWDAQLVKKGVTEFIDGQSVGPNMTYVFNRQKTTPPPAPIATIRRDGLVFRRADTNDIWKWRGITAFRAHEFLVKGERGRVDDFFGWAASLGCNVARVFGTWVVTNFDPRLFPHYYETIPATVELARAHGLHLHWTCFTDQVDGSAVKMTPSQQDDHLRRTLDALRASGYAFPEVNNEDWKNGRIAARFDPSLFAGLLATRSAPPDGEDPRNYGTILEWTTDHTPRGSEWQRKFKMLLETSRLGGAGAACQRPAISGEPSRLGEGTTAREWADYAAGCELFGEGMTIHGSRPSNGESGLQDCEIQMSSGAKSCLDAVVALWKDNPIPLDAASTGEYSRTDEGSGVGPVCEHAGAMRSYAMKQGARATLVRVAETSPAIPIDGWRIVERRGPQQQVYLLER